ncbi:MAG: tetratricopeptide repeat protein [Candidatus Levybacteria bacterium]|nr:tetratricopeptide repeat protein [Candidatus Levybacteria bacterium]
MIKQRSKKQEINLNRKIKSPSISRSITESILASLRSEKWVLLASVSGVFFLCLMLYAIVQLSHSLRVQKQVMQEKAKVMRDMSFWQNVTVERPEYRDGYFMLAVLQYQIGKKQEAVATVQKALEIDPNFKEGRELERILSN